MKNLMIRIRLFIHGPKLLEASESLSLAIYMPANRSEFVKRVSALNLVIQRIRGGS